MSGNSIVVDSNIILYLLNGDYTLAEFLNEKSIYISFITELELLSFKELKNEERNQIKKLISDSTVVDINSTIKENTLALRKKYQLKLPDSIILATSLYLGFPFITADKKLKDIEEISIIQYQLS